MINNARNSGVFLIPVLCFTFLVPHSTIPPFQSLIHVLSVLMGTMACYYWLNSTRQNLLMKDGTYPRIQTFFSQEKSRQSILSTSNNNQKTMVSAGRHGWSIIVSSHYCDLTLKRLVRVHVSGFNPFIPEVWITGPISLIDLSQDPFVQYNFHWKIYKFSLPPSLEGTRMFTTYSFPPS